MDIYKKSVKSMISKYKWNSLFVRNFKKYFFLLLIPIMIFMSVIYYVYRLNIMNGIKNNIDVDFRNRTNMVNSAFEDCSKLYNMLVVDDSLINCSKISKLNHSNREDVKSLSNITSTIKKYCNIMTSTEKIVIYMDKNKYVLSTGENETIELYLDKDYLKKRIKEYIPNQIVYPGENDDCIDVVYKLNFENDYDTFIIITMNMSRIIGSIDDAKPKSVALYSDDKTVYSCGKIYNDEGKNEFFESDKNQQFLEYDNLDYNVKLVEGIEKKVFAEHSKQLIPVFISCILLILLIAVVLSYVLSIQYYNSISNIAAFCQNNLLEYDIGQNEIDLIYSSINGLRNKLKNTEEIITKQVIDLKKLQISVLQNQINPHFLFNTLNSISVLIIDETGEDSKTVILIEKLSSMLTDLMNTKSVLITIGEEIEYTRKYIDIESIKHLDNFDVEWDIKKEVTKYMTPKLILQPIVENALGHGIYPLPKTKRGKISIKVYKSNNNIYFKICDNGVGFDKTTLEKMKKNLDDNVFPDSKHIGVLNVNIRIRNMYGDKYGCSITSDENGTDASIIIPISEA